MKKHYNVVVVGAGHAGNEAAAAAANCAKAAVLVEFFWRRVGSRAGFWLLVLRCSEFLKQTTAFLEFCCFFIERFCVLLRLLSLVCTLECFVCTIRLTIWLHWVVWKLLKRTRLLTSQNHQLLLFPSTVHVNPKPPCVSCVPLNIALNFFFLFFSFFFF